MSSKQLSVLMRRIDRTVLQKWRLPAALCIGFVVLLAFYFFRLLDGSIHLPPNYHGLATASNCAAINLGGTSRLARTLEGNEKRYQRMLVEREQLIEKSGGKQIVAFPGAYVFAAVLWDIFIPAFSCPFPTYRVGTLADGGKWVCGLDRVLKHQPNPIIYSLNDKTPTYSSFEQDIIERSPGCQIYAFDANATPEVASQWPWGSADVATDLLRVMRDFGHDWIDILKIELQGSEFTTLLDIIADHKDKDAPLPFGNPTDPGMQTVDHFSTWFTKLECAGLRPYYFEVNMLDVNNRRAEPSIAYVSACLREFRLDLNAFVVRPKRSRAKAPRVKAVAESVSDQEDSDFELPDLVDLSDSEGSDDEMDVDNTELASILPSKTIPARSKVANSKTQTRAAAAPSAKRKQTSESASAPATKKVNRRATVEEVEDDEAPPIRTSSPVNAARNSNDRKAKGDFDQATFDRLLAFDEVEKPEVIALLEYTHHGSTRIRHAGRLDGTYHDIIMPAPYKGYFYFSDKYRRWGFKFWQKNDEQELSRRTSRSSSRASFERY
ncbi:hypothetical protein B0H13DRAFT_2648595 [Mycena leptocephala]|nr:hypothetical protein B0H13DRAFT_2648595 [Mycena leptocephala]